MPYTEIEAREDVDHSILMITTEGDLNYYITTKILDTWNKEPRYKTIHYLYKVMITSPKDSPLLAMLRRELADRFDVADIYTAGALAFLEFYRRVGSTYEDVKRVKNGDLPGYTVALKPFCATPLEETK